MSPRKDAVENRAKLVAAARQVFAAKGFDATLDDIAAHAGLGTATAYRHFTDKYELAGEILAEATQQIADDAIDALAMDDPWDGIVYFFETTARRQASSRALYQSLAGRGRAADKARIWPDIVKSVTKLFTNAKRAGVLRQDLAPEDAVAIFAMLGALDEFPGTDPWQRYLALVLDGLRTPTAEALPGTAGRYDTLDDMTAVTKRRK